jgi:sugar lactone lactonase YvrE
MSANRPRTTLAISIGSRSNEARSATFAAALLAVAAFAAGASAHDWNGLAADRAGNLFAVDAEDGHVWKISPDGKASTFVDGERGSKLNHPHHLEIDSDDHLWLAGG